MQILPRLGLPRMRRKLAPKMDGLRLPLPRQRPLHRGAPRWLLQRRAMLPLRLRAIAFRRPRLAPPAANVGVPVAEAAVGAAALPLRAEAQQDDRRHPPLRPLPRTRPPATRTSRIGIYRTNGSQWEPFLLRGGKSYAHASGKNHARVTYDGAAITGHIRGRRVLHQFRSFHAQRVQRREHGRRRSQPAHGNLFVAASVVESA